MKNIQVIDGAANCVYDIFAAPDDVFARVFSPGTDIAFVEDLQLRPDADDVFEALGSIWPHRLPKARVNGIHGTLFYGLIEKRRFYPTLRDEEARNPDGSLVAPTPQVTSTGSGHRLARYPSPQLVARLPSFVAGMGGSLRKCRSCDDSR